LHTLKGHTEPIWCLCELNNGNIASGSVDKTIKIWNTQNKSCIFTIKGHSQTVWCIIPLKSGDFLSGSADGTVKIWNHEDKICKATFYGLYNYGWPYNIIESKYGHLITWTWDTSIRIWNINIEDGQTATLEGHSHNVRCVVELKNGDLVSGSDDETIKLWNIKSKTCSYTLKLEAGVISLIALKNNELVSGSRDKLIKIWNMKSKVCLATLIGHEYDLLCFIKSNNEDELYGSDYHGIRIWKRF
jgi:WD40 repeat protein